MFMKESESLNIDFYVDTNFFTVGVWELSFFVLFNESDELFDMSWRLPSYLGD